MNVNCSHTKIVDIDSLVPNPRNPNKHGEKQIEMLAKILKYQGWRHPIIVSRRSGFVVSGHGRLMAAKKNKWEQVPIDEQDFEDEAAEFAHLIADNKIAELADHDDEAFKLSAIELGFDLNGFDLDLFGVPDLDLRTDDEKRDAIEDEVPEVTKSVSKLGDLYELGEHRLLCGDSTDKDTVERLMNGEKADMVFTDPPYGINESAAKRETRETNSLAKSNKHLKEFKDDSISYAIDAFNICETLAIPIQIWFGANYYCHSLPQTNNWLVWDKRLEEKHTDNNSDAELAWVQDGRSSVRLFRHLWKGLIKGSEHGHSRVHPTQKPTALAEWCLNKYAQAKSCLDLFGGSGSTLIACEKTKRKCFMMELDPHYIDVIVSRWCKYTGKTSIKRNGEPMEWVI